MLQILITIVALLLFSLAIGSPVTSAMGFTAVISALLFMDAASLKQFGLIAFGQGTSMNQLIAPLFILMAEFLARGRIAEDIYYVLNKYLKGIRGGLAMSTTLACTVFAALCGSSPATAATMGRISVDQMTKRNYKTSFAIGTVAGGGTLGIMIPPSITLIAYGIITENSIAKLLMAGLMPGLMLAALMLISLAIRVKLNPGLIGETKKIKKYAESQLSNNTAALPEEKEQKTGFLSDIKLALPALILIFIVLGAMYSGLATPMESAGFGAIGAFVILLFKRRMNIKLFIETMQGTSKTGIMIIFLMISGFCLSYVVSYLGIASDMAKMIVASGLNRWVIMTLLYILWFILGCLMDPGSMVILTVPFIYPTLLSLGFDPIWVGIVSTICVEIGMITPPVGLNLFILRSSTGVDMNDIIKGAFPFVFVLLLGLIILNFFPQIALWLPGQL